MARTIISSPLFSPSTEYEDGHNALKIYHGLDEAVHIINKHESVVIAEEEVPFTATGHHTVITAPKTNKHCLRLHTRSISDAHSLCGPHKHSFDTLYSSFSGARAARQRRRLFPIQPMAFASREQTAVFDPEPDSPPELTSSKSSKSSSFRTSSSLGDSASPHDPSHFEDITLDEIHSTVSTDTYSADAPNTDYRSHSSDKENYSHKHGSLSVSRTRSSVSSVSSARSSGQSSATTTVPIRDLTHTQRPGFPSLKRQVNDAVTINGRATQSALHLPGPKSPRRGVTSPVNPQFSTPPLPPPSQRSRSPSPTFLQSFGLNQRAPRRSSSRSSLHSTTSFGPIARRSSWQPGRKTVKELEDEYHDSDEDIPDDAVVWNVPISPRPPHSRNPSFNPPADSIPPTPLTVPLPRTMTLPVPEPDPQPQSGSLHTLRRQRSTPAILEDANHSKDLKPRPSPRSSRRPSPLRSVADFTKMQDIQAYGKSRTKSYSEAMDDLSNDARHITEVLEAFELQRSKSDGTPSTTTSDANASSYSLNTQFPSATSPPLSPEPSSAISRSVNGRTVVSLPPLRKGDVMIDPLPVSKEKEKVLTRTRPSWLPPKNQKEEKRHLKEYKRMMEASLEADKKRVARIAAEQEARDAAAASLQHIWESYILQAWSEALGEPRTRELWWRGVPPQHRGEVWLRATGNELHLTETSYEAALKRAGEDQSRLMTLNSQLSEGGTLKDENAERWAWFERMRADINSLAQDAEWTDFAAPNAQHEQLMDVLQAYAYYRSDVGYVSGLHRLAALLLLNMSAASAFIVMANFLNRPLPMAYLLTTLRFRSTPDADMDAMPVPAAVSNTHSLILKTLAYKLPSLHAHLTSQSLGLRPSDYLDPLLSTFFTDPRIGVEKMSRMWDVMVFEGDKVLLRTAVAVLSRLENRLYGSKEEILSILGWQSTVQWGVDLGDAEEWTLAMREAGKADRKEE